MNLSIQWTKTTARRTSTLLFAADDGCYYLASTVRNPDGDVESLVFPARETGDVIEHTDLAGGCQGVSHEEAIEAFRAMSAANVVKCLESAW
jgi:hypothetical protein